ncbi:hypothetical protein ABL78_8560 [Leptomonas seymouri]|uniref:Uncharacterized protein n=1 Tax=Leptomonas seymouri TaxID=5684 RepID=A0A0N1I0F2_LEPSE|nr:hypothetical protein ABL78_8560 [Leptomonas seymouri]|eukprot:KPI82430.1 hypothetical protein ABL78_8560 [Leptomonas seymouri]
MEAIITSLKSASPFLISFPPYQKHNAYTAKKRNCVLPYVKPAMMPFFTLRGPSSRTASLKAATRLSFMLKEVTVRTFDSASVTIVSSLSPSFTAVYPFIITRSATRAAMLRGRQASATKASFH